MAIISDWNIRHNGKEYSAGEVVTLSKDEEQRIVDRGLARIVEDPKKPSSKKAVKDNEDTK